MRCILDQSDLMLGAQIDKGGRVMRNASVVDRDDSTGAGRDQAAHLIRIECQGIGPDVGENQARSEKRKRAGGCDKGVGGHDHFIIRQQIEKQGAHFQCRCATRCEQDFGTLKMITQPLRGALGEEAVPGGLTRGERFLKVSELIGGGPSSVKRECVHGWMDKRNDQGLAVSPTEGCVEGMVMACRPLMGAILWVLRSQAQARSQPVLPAGRWATLI